LVRVPAADELCDDLLVEVHFGELDSPRLTHEK